MPAERCRRGDNGAVATEGSDPGSAPGDQPPDPGREGLSRRTVLGLGAAAGVAVLGGAVVVRSVRDGGSGPSTSSPAGPTSPGGPTRDPADRSPSQTARTGYRDVSAMLAADPFLVAHRGCSRTWPEMSGYAYAQATAAGFGALELSLSRTSDGVWFGLHDATLDRTSGVTGRTANAMTWAEVSGYRIRGSVADDHPDQPDRPYLRWEEMVATHYPDQVIFVDPKEAQPFAAELVALMDALPGTAQEHLVLKSFGRSGPDGAAPVWARLAREHGYRSWGYFYGADASRLAVDQVHWDLLGMDWAADGDAWRQVTSFDKPVIGHIVATADQAARALDRGARGLMASAAELLAALAAA